MLSIKKDVINELHAPGRRKFPTRRVIIKGLENLFQIDLIEKIPYAKKNDGYKYIFICINCFSKYAWAAPLKNKKASTVSEAMEKILSRNSKKIPRNIQSDHGNEFYNNNFGNVMNKYGINHYRYGVLEVLGLSSSSIKFQLTIWLGRFIVISREEGWEEKFVPVNDIRIKA
ncbi:Integrase core domain [Popillia japonica]|uniref:Integrase core domain n=1 Tax=Popillia japonica TaxID=7064 RepID=A0AAW1IC62_POPJA